MPLPPLRRMYWNTVPTLNTPRNSPLLHDGDVGVAVFLHHLHQPQHPLVHVGLHHLVALGGELQWPGAGGWTKSSTSPMASTTGAEGSTTGSPLQVGAVGEQVADLPADFQLIPHRGAFVVLDKLEHHAGIVPPGVAVFDPPARPPAACTGLKTHRCGFACRLAIPQAFAPFIPVCDALPLLPQQREGDVVVHLAPWCTAPPGAAAAFPGKAQLFQHPLGGFVLHGTPGPKAPAPPAFGKGVGHHAPPGPRSSSLGRRNASPTKYSRVRGFPPGGAGCPRESHTAPASSPVARSSKIEGPARGLVLFQLPLRLLRGDGHHGVAVHHIGAVAQLQVGVPVREPGPAQQQALCL